MSTEPWIDPEVQELLGAAVASPDSRLMRVPRGGFTRWLTQREGPRSEQEPFLPQIESYLLREHREQVAYLLRKAAQDAVYRLPPWESLTHNSRRGVAGSNVHADEDDRWSSQLEAARAARPYDPQARAQLESFAAVLTVGPRGAGCASSLAGASCALAPRDETRIWYGIALDIEGSSAEARGLFESVLACHPAELNASWAQQDLATLLLLKDQVPEAHERYRAAAMLGPPRPSALLGWLHTALRVPDRASAMSAAGSLMELPEASFRTSIEDHVNMWKERRSRGLFMPSARSAELAAQVSGELPSAIAEVARVFLPR
jgi:hypothetical protein